MSLNDNIVDIEKPDWIDLPNFVVYDFSGLFYIHQSFLSKTQDLNK